MRHGMQWVDVFSMRMYRSLVGLLVVALLSALVPAGLQPASAAGGNASIDLSKTITATTLTPALGLAFAVDHASAIPGTPLTYIATISNTGTNLALTGAFIARNNGDVAATVAAYYDYVEYFAVAQNQWVPLAGTAATQPGYTPLEAAPIQSGLTLVATAVPTTGVTYPTSGDPILGTALALGRTASWTYRAAITLTPAQVALLLDPARVSGIRNVVHFEVTPRPARLGQPYKYRVDFITPLRTQSGTVTNAVITVAPPTGPPMRFDSTTTPALASLAPGASTTVQTTYDVPVLAAKGAGETDAAYLARLRAADNAILTATADASATSTGGTITLPQATARTTEQLPIVTIHKSGPAQLVAGATATYDLALANGGSAPASALALPDTLSNGASAVVSDVPSTLSPAATATAHATYAVPREQASGTLTDTATLTWRDANGNAYGSLADSFATVIQAVGQGGTLTLAPASAGPNVTGTSQALTATARNADGTPIANLSVHFIVTGTNPTSGDAITDASGTATFSYQGANHGQDTVTATATAGGNLLTSNTATVFWITPVQQVATTTVWGRFFTSNGSGSFNIPTSQPPAFAQTFPTIDFNPPAGTVPGNTSGVGVNTRPFTNITTDLNGNYTGSIIAQGNGYQAGVGALFDFQAVFTGQYVVAVPGNVTFNFYSDDGFIFGIGNGATRVSGANTNPPASGRTPFENLPVMGAYNVPTSPIANSITVYFPAAGTYPYELDYSECCGGELSITMTTAGSGNHGVPPSGVLTISPNSAASKPTGQQQSFTATATDASGVALSAIPVTLAIIGPNGQQLTGTTNAAGQATFSYTGAYPGTDTVQAIAWVSGIAVYSAQVNVPWTVGAPPQPAAPLSIPGWLGGPANQSSVSGLVPITLASGITLQTGTITYWPADDPSAVTTLATNVHGSGGATLATLDTTTLANGSYIISLSGTNSSGTQVNSGVLITVVGEYKPGRVRFSVTDLTVPVTGLPITIGRTYDSLERGRSGDFGYGWSLSLGSPSVKTDQAHNVTLTQPDGRRVTFYFTPRSVGGIFGFLLLPGYTAEPGVYGSLTADGCGLMVVSGGSYMCFLDSPIYNPSIYTYTDPYGRIFTMGSDGSLKAISDLDGNTLTFGPNGITSSAGGLNVPFVRDGQGRITRITDPAGNVYGYSYDAAGNLASVAVPGTSPINYSYDASHLFLSAVDPRGNTLITDTYYPDGRLASETDALGNIYQYAYDLSAHRTTVTNPDGGSQTTIADNYGMTTSLTDPLGHTTTFTYNGNHNLLTQTDPLGHTTTYTYDANGHQTSITDALGHTSSTTYNQFGGPTAKTDALGNLRTINYDAHFRPSQVTDSLGTLGAITWDAHGSPLTRSDGNGKLTSFTYDAYGNTLSETDPLGHATTLTYDQLGRTLTSADPLGHTTSYTYDGLGHLLTATDPLSHVTSYSYDANGNRILAVDPAGRHTTYTYDTANHLTRVAYPDGTSDRYTYDWRGNVLSTTDRAGNITRRLYDLAGRLSHITYADGTTDASSVSYSYDAAGRKVSRTDGLGHTITYTYDAADNLLSVSAPLGHTTTYTYDANKRRSSATNANNHTTHYHYDTRGRLDQTTYADGTLSHWSYDGAGYPISYTDQAGKITTYHYDDASRLLSVTDPLGHVTSYTYDATDNPLTITDANGHQTSFAYDALGQRVQKTWPDGSVETMGYDAAGNQISHGLTDGHINTASYDSMNRLAQVNSFDGQTVAYTYTPTGQRATVTDARGVTHYSYDSRERLTGITVPDGQTIGYTYDAADNRLSLLTPAGTTSYDYDAADRLVAITDAFGATSSYSYDNAGLRTQLALANGVTVDYTYDSRSRLTQIVQHKGAQTLAAYSYTLGPTGNRLGVTEADNSSIQWSYDDAYRLLNETRRNSGGTISAQASYTYDATGNRLSQTVDSQTTTYQYNALDQLTSRGTASYAYDGRGNLVGVTDGASITHYSYDANDRLTGVSLPTGSSQSYAYDADGRRVRQSAGAQITNYLWDEASAYGDVVMESDGGGATLASYVLGNRELLAQRRSGTVSYDLHDGQGSVRVLADSSGGITDRYSYNAFGDLQSQQGTTTNPYRYTGQQFDALTGLYSLRARYYDPSSGRFLSRDTLDVGLDHPVEINRYVYAANNPINLTDPTGHQTLGEYSSELSSETPEEIAATEETGTAAEQAIETIEEDVAEAVDGAEGGGVDSGGGGADEPPSADEPPPGEPSGRDALDDLLNNSEKGNTPRVREVKGSFQDAEDAFNRIADPASIKPHPNPALASKGGLQGEVPGGGRIYFRPYSSSVGPPDLGPPTIDIHEVPGLEGIKEIKFLP